MQKQIKTWALILLCALWACLFAFGLAEYPGAKASYILFSGVFLLLAASALYRPKYYGYVFFAFFLWLGFWLKTTLHLILKYPYSELTGGFDFSPASWDNALFVSSVGAAGLIVSFLVYTAAAKAFTTSSVPAPGAPVWYAGLRRRLWLLWGGAAILVPATNSLLGIHQVGLVPRTILAWPGNALLAWLLNVGIAMGLATLIQWDKLLGQTRLFSFFAISVESFLSSISVLSRGSFVYHGLPLFFAALKTRLLPGRFSNVKALTVMVVFVVSFFSSVFLVNVFRRALYADIPAGYSLRQDLFREAARLVVDRWVGIEGVMSLQAYPGKSPGLLMRALTESRELDKTSLYESICNSRYQNINLTKYQFSSIPGPVALFYYSGAAWAALAGLFLLGLMVLVFEEAVWSLTRNPFMCSLLGMMAANNAAQFGAAPRQMFPTYFLILLVLFALWALEKNTAKGAI